VPPALLGTWNSENKPKIIQDLWAADLEQFDVFIAQNYPNDGSDVAEAPETAPRPQVEQDTAPFWPILKSVVDEIHGLYLDAIAFQDEKQLKGLQIVRRYLWKSLERTVKHEAKDIPLLESYWNLFTKVGEKATTKYGSMKLFAQSMLSPPSFT